MKKIAVIKTGGKQYLVSPKEKLKVERIAKREGEEFYFSEILLFADKNTIKIGTPFVEGVKVKAKVLSHRKGEKITILKHKPKKRYKVKKGHRQPFTEIEILSIESEQ